MNHALSNFEIKTFLKSDPVAKKYFKGFLFPRDDLKIVKTVKNIKTPSLYVINTDFITGKGLHWVLVFYTAKKTYFFDSLALPPILYNFFTIIERKNLPVIRNTFTVQNISEESFSCGHFVIVYAVLLTRGYSLVEINKIFSKNRALNDKIVVSWLGRMKKNLLAKKTS